MALITEIEVKNFRSLRNVHLEGLAASNAIAGPNNSGKSNLLRALNLFFNDEVEADEPIDLRQDHYSPWGNRKKRIAVSVRFDLSAGFKYGKKYQTAERLLGYRPFVRRTWEYDRSGGVVPGFATYDEDRQAFVPADEAQARVIRSFLGLFKFRYVPNHMHPSELIDLEQDELQRNLVRRLRNVLTRTRGRQSASQQDESGPTLTGEIFGTLNQIADRVTRPIAQALTKASGELEAVELDTAQGLDEVVFLFGFFMQSVGGARLPATLQGSGLQAHLAYQMIHFLDTSFGQYFGTRQTVIWAVEEPESFLHARLEYYVAQFLLERAASEERFQVFCTTHSDTFSRLAAMGILVEFVDGESRCQTMEPRDLVRRAPALGISRFVHSLLYELGPLVLVEGKTDKSLLERAHLFIGDEHAGILHCLETLGDTERAGGKDDLLTYLRLNRAVINSRPLDAPILVVLDWDVRDRLVEDYQKALAGHPFSGVLRCDTTHANPQLGESFKGIERYLSTRVIRHAGQEQWLALLRPADGEYPLEVSARSLKDGKTRLTEYACREGTKDDFSYLVQLAREIDAFVKGAIASSTRPQ